MLKNSDFLEAKRNPRRRQEFLEELFDTTNVLRPHQNNIFDVNYNHVNGVTATHEISILGYPAKLYLYDERKLSLIFPVKDEHQGPFANLWVDSKKEELYSPNSSQLCKFGLDVDHFSFGDVKVSETYEHGLAAWSGFKLLQSKSSQSFRLFPCPHKNLHDLIVSMSKYVFLAGDERSMPIHQDILAFINERVEMNVSHFGNLLEEYREIYKKAIDLQLALPRTKKCSRHFLGYLEGERENLEKAIASK